VSDNKITQKIMPFKEDVDEDTNESTTASPEDAFDDWNLMNDYTNNEGPSQVLFHSKEDSLLNESTQDTHAYSLFKKEVLKESDHRVLFVKELHGSSRRPMTLTIWFLSMKIIQITIQSLLSV